MKLDLPALQAFFASAPFMVDLGVVPIAVQEGRVTTTLVLAPRHLQHSGRVHAGVMLSMADHTMGAAAQTLAEAGRAVVTAEVRISLLNAAAGERLVCEAWVLRAGRKISFTEADVFIEAAGKRLAVAKASATMALTGAAPKDRPSD